MRQHLSILYAGYMPTQYYNLESSYGSEAQLKALIKELHKAGIKAVADIVINHRCGDKQDANGVWNVFEVRKIRLHARQLH